MSLAYARAVEIMDGCANGHWLPVIRSLALRGFPEAMTVLADHDSAMILSRVTVAYRSAWRRGSVTAAYNCAIEHFNRRDLGGYRHWLYRAAKTGDDEAAAALAAFETRLPHHDARRIGRQRPLRRSER